MRALVDDRVRVVPVEFRIVGHEVFGRGANTLALDAIDVADGDARREVRVLAEVLEVAAVQRSAVMFRPGPRRKFTPFARASRPICVPTRSARAGSQVAARLISAAIAVAGPKLRTPIGPSAMRRAGTPNSGMARIKNPSVPPSRSIFCSRLILARIASARASASDSAEDCNLRTCSSQQDQRRHAHDLDAALHHLLRLGLKQQRSKFGQIAPPHHPCMGARGLDSREPHAFRRQPILELPVRFDELIVGAARDP